MYSDYKIIISNNVALHYCYSCTPPAYTLVFSFMYMYVFLSTILPSYFVLHFFMFRLSRCEDCTEDILSKDEDSWFCPGCEQWTPCPTPAMGNSTFQIEEPEYALYQFDNQEDTNSRDNPSTSFNR